MGLSWNRVVSVRTLPRGQFCQSSRFQATLGPFSVRFIPEISDHAFDCKKSLGIVIIGGNLIDYRNQLDIVVPQQLVQFQQSTGIAQTRAWFSDLKRLFQM